MNMEEDNIYRKIQEAISSLPDNFSILEEQIDVELQMEYFNFRQNLQSGYTQKKILQFQKDLSDPVVSLEAKKNILVILASQEKVKTFRAIEKYACNPDPELRQWSILALQESRMVIQSSLLDEQQVYISTGLGGKGQKLRYFVVFIGRENGVKYSLVQCKIIQTELEFALKKHNGTLEEISFHDNLAVTVLLFPVKADLQSVFIEVIRECNQYGDFVDPDIIITNVKTMSIDEIKDFVARKNK